MTSAPPPPASAAHTATKKVKIEKYITPHTSGIDERQKQHVRSWGARPTGQRVNEDRSDVPVQCALPHCHGTGSVQAVWSSACQLDCRPCDSFSFGITTVVLPRAPIVLPRTCNPRPHQVCSTHFHRYRTHQKRNRPPDVWGRRRCLAPNAATSPLTTVPPFFDSGCVDSVSRNCNSPCHGDETDRRGVCSFWVVR